MGLTNPKFISINEACAELETSKRKIVYNVLFGGLPVYAYGTSEIKATDGSGIIYGTEVYQEPDRLTNPRPHQRNPEHDAVILATYPIHHVSGNRHGNIFHSADRYGGQNSLSPSLDFISSKH
jgi:hypothetical protein